MDRNLNALRSWLAQRYENLGMSLSEAHGVGRGAVWVTEEPSYADLLDAEVGAWVRFSSLDGEKDLYSRVMADVRWALDALSKLDVRSGLKSEKVDELGAWQVHVVWIVPGTAKLDWEHAIRDLRRRSAHPEEIGLDLIDLQSGSIEQVLADEGIPCLLLHTRALARLDVSTVPQWISPDALFEERLMSYLGSIKDEKQRTFSQDVANSFLPRGDIADDLAKFAVRPFSRATFKDFRNIVEAELSFDYLGSALVLHGPNGTGKSSLFEGLCLALFGTSKRHHDFLCDSDVTSKARGDYVGSVLTRFGSGGRAEVTLDGENSLRSLISSPQESSARLTLASGTMLAQESARDFVGLDSAKAAALVLGDYSPRARRFQEEVERGATQSKVAWQDWLRAQGLNAAISKPETILRKLVTRAISAHCPPLSQVSNSWLRSLGKRFPVFATRANELLWLLVELDSASVRDDVAERVATAIERSEPGADVIEDWLRRRSETVLRLGQLVEDSRKILEPLSAEWPRISGEVRSWAEWARRPAQERPGEPLSDDLERAALDKECRDRLAQLTPLGQLLKSRKDHLDQLMQGLLPTWSKLHPHVCPTCETGHVDEVRVVIARIAQSVSDEYKAVRSEYASVQTQLKAVQVQAGTAGAPPIADDRMAELSEALGFSQSGPDSLDALLREAGHGWSAMLSSTEALFAGPGENVAEGAEAAKARSQAVIAQVVEMRADGARKQQLPLQWDELKRRVDELALQIVSGHLPKTVGAVWREIALALAPSRWNQAASPQMSMDIKRGAERLGIVIDGNERAVPARHVLNQAEQHVLGLAWFFTRHLSHGRFVTPMIALDDPAQEMDQVTYRRFARFLQAFLRIHRRLEKMLSVFVLLHQEERALELARATSSNGGLTILEWSREIRSKGPESTMRKLLLRNAQQQPPLPPALAGDAVPPMRTEGFSER